MKELIARASLFSQIEAGHGFWSKEIYEFGPLYVYEKLLSGAYGQSKHEKLISDLRSTSGEKVIETILANGASLLTPQDFEWPEQLNDLANPPIALVVKGNLNVLKTP